MRDFYDWLDSYRRRVNYYPAEFPTAQCSTTIHILSGVNIKLLAIMETIENFYSANYTYRLIGPDGEAYDYDPPEKLMDNASVQQSGCRSAGFPS